MLASEPKRAQEGFPKVMRGEQQGRLEAQQARSACDTRTARLGVLCPWDSPGKNIGVGYHFLPQGTFLTQRD